VIYRIVLTKEAEEMFLSISDKQIQQQIKKRISLLQADPHKGKPLTGDLADYRSIRAASGRYRILYNVKDKKVTVYVVAIGIRQEGSVNDIYAVAKKMLKIYLQKKRLQ
jgi:mRNA interferase RelE/StbE